ncbi:hypothetical protein OCU04_001528 [Sclerotinia nivalis]|uniref:Uncharacterized protein n=1 Tax=Sclerotinia nivalis TaxID=352851 RepID=A0A9X0DQQ8_9HELO|nr:hypothetical protein OCU04_001528 [Sclerotinia nivalis]
MTRVSNFAQLFCAFVLAAQIHAANVPPPWRPDPDLRPHIRPPPISDPVPTTCSTSTVSIECGNNACQSAWATAFTSSNAYVQSFCSSFTSPGRQNTNRFDRKGPATACTRGLNNAAVQSSISSVCSCYAGPGVPTQAFTTICPSCPHIQTQTVTTSIPTTIIRTASASIKTVTTIITLIIDPPPPSRITTTTTTTTQTITTTNSDLISAPCTTTTNILTTTQVTAIYDYFTWTTTTYQAGRYPCATTICPAPTLSTATTTITVTLVIDPLPIEYTVTETVAAGVCTTTWDDDGFWPSPSLFTMSSSLTPTDETATPMPTISQIVIAIDEGGLTWRETSTSTLVAPSSSDSPV